MQRKVSRSLTLQHDRIVYLLENCEANLALVHRYIDVYEYPDGEIEIRADGQSLRYERYDRLGQIDTSAIVENKRLGHALQTALILQAQRDDRRIKRPRERTVARRRSLYAPLLAPSRRVNSRPKTWRSPFGRSAVQQPFPSPAHIGTQR